MITHSHRFALYLFSAVSWEVGVEVGLDDNLLIHRIEHVLRLSVGDSVILFDQKAAFSCLICAIKKRKILLRVERKDLHRPLQPEIHWLLPILEKDAFSESLIHATVMGVTSITPVITKQSGRQVRIASDRQVKLMAAAAEQSKQFVFPQINMVMPLEEAIKMRDQSVPFIVFDEDGSPAFSLLTHLADCSPKKLYVLSGPEGGLVAEEVAEAKKSGAQLCALTPTILRAWVAVSLGAGLLRSCLR